MENAPSTRRAHRPTSGRSGGKVLWIATVVIAMMSAGVSGGAASAVSKARFRMKLDASALTVARNDASSVTVLVTRLGTFEGKVALSSSKRTGLKVTFDENPLESDDTDLNVIADGTAKLGSTTITVTAKSGTTTVKVLLRVTVKPAVPKAAVPTATTAAAAATTVATATTVAAATTTVGATTSTVGTTTTVAGTTTTSAPPATVGDVVITRKVSQNQRCAAAATASPAATVTLKNTGTSARVVSWVVPGTCFESNFTPALVVAPGATSTNSFPNGSLIIARSSSTAGSPIRAVVKVQPNANFDLSGSMTVALNCSGLPGTAVTLTDGGQSVTVVPAGTACSAVTIDGNPLAITDNAGITTDGIVLVPGRPSRCPIASATTPVPGPTGCYSEFLVVN